MSTRQLPARPSLDHLKNRASNLLREALANDPAALARLSTPAPKQADALHAMALALSSEDATAALIAALKANDTASLDSVLATHTE
jgi:hypothetical protein